MSDENTQKSHLYYVLPGEIFDTDELSASEKMLYMLLSGLSHKDGSCYPSNQYLSDRMKISEKQIKDWLKKLDDLGYISRETHSCPSNPFKKIRTITVHSSFKKCLRREENHPIDKVGFHPPVGTETSPIVSEVILVSEDNPPISPKSLGEPMPSARSPFIKKRSKKPKPEKIEVAKFVRVTADQAEDLLKRCCGGDVKLLKEAYDAVSTWKIGKSIGDRPNDYKAIKDWGIKAAEENRDAPKPRSAGDYKDLIKKIPVHADIIIGHNYIEFDFGPNNRPHVKFTDHGFKEQIENYLRKMSLKLLD